VGRERSDTHYIFRLTQIGTGSAPTTVLLRGDHTLCDLHRAMCYALNRHDDGIYSFYFPRAETGGDIPEAHPKEYTSAVMMGQPDSPSDDEPSNAASTTLDSLHLLVGQTFEYLFDFGDSSLHMVKVVARHPFKIKKKTHTVGEPVWDASEAYLGERFT